MTDLQWQEERILYFTTLTFMSLKIVQVNYMIVCIQNENWEIVAAQMSSLVLQKMYEFSSVVLEKLGERCGLKMADQPTV